MFYQYIFDMISCFAVENLEWEFFDNCARDYVVTNETGSKIKNRGGHAKMRLFEKIKLDSNYEMKIRIGSELQTDAFLNIGLFKRKNKWDEFGMGISLESSEKSNEGIYYSHRDGQIFDNKQEIKSINRKLHENFIITFMNKKVKKTKYHEKLFQESILVNENEKCVLFYQDARPMVPFLQLDDKIELDVEVRSKF